LLQQAILENGTDELLSSHLADARLAVMRSAKLLNESKDKIDKGQRADAEKCRSEALIALRNETSRLGKIIPEPHTPNNPKTLACAEALLHANIYMRQAIELMKEKRDSASVQQAMQKATESLKTANTIRMRTVE
jgi:hypothetical protein